MAGEIQLNSVSLATESSSAITLGSAVSLNSAAYASTSEVQGTHTTGSITSGTTSLTVASGSGISNGDYVVGEGITPGTTVSSGGGTTSITLSANAGETLSSDRVSFYKADKVLSPGLVAAGLCRAWVNFDGDPVGIRASFNVSSVGDNGGLGNFRVNFTTAMPDADYCVQLSTSTPTGGAGQHAIDENDITTTYVDVLTWNYNASAQTDRNHYYVSIFR